MKFAPINPHKIQWGGGELPHMPEPHENYARAGKDEEARAEREAHEAHEADEGRDLEDLDELPGEKRPNPGFFIVFVILFWVVVVVAVALRQWFWG